MAGSYKHIVNEEGQFVGGELLENGGDVYEGVEEMYGMIWLLADGDASKVEWARQNWKRGFELSPGRGEFENE